MEILIWAIIVFLGLFTILPFSKISHGFVRAAAFPRLQILCVALLTAVAAYFTLEGQNVWMTIGLLLAISLVQAAYIARFTPLWHRQTRRADPPLSEETDRHVSILASNVKMSNRAYDKLLKVIKDESPDLLILLEVDTGWIEALEPLRDEYQDVVERAHDNGYGIALYSKHKLFDVEIRDLLVEDVPSIRTGVELRSGEKFRLYGIHPEPPVPSHDTEGRDSEIALVGFEAADDQLPAIVCGDLNDVAWSSTTRRFQRLSCLLDPRVGRGFFNTFDARIPLIRWPLDHLFHDARFRLLEMKRLPKIGSDHFPILFRLALGDDERAKEKPQEAGDEEEQDAKEMIAREKKNDREAIGSEWEKE